MMTIIYLTSISNGPYLQWLQYFSKFKGVCILQSIQAAYALVQGSAAYGLDLTHNLAFVAFSSRVFCRYYLMLPWGKEVVVTGP